MRGAYKPPSGQIPGRVEIGVALEATPETQELGLRTSVAFLDKATAAARPAGVAWVHEHDRHAQALRLIADERSQLPEASTRVLVALAFANRHPVAYPRQVFEGQRGLRVFGVRDKLFGNKYQTKSFLTQQC